MKSVIVYIVCFSIDVNMSYWQFKMVLQWAVDKHQHLKLVNCSLINISIMNIVFVIQIVLAYTFKEKGLWESSTTFP